ncbi:unnamed protein product [Caenorhabditis auriculariae]|uniref:Peptidase S1 domain-containing protein n=1 Tax=Caenorhabditis auriculariae TaxID=2777116 RepID=A0A8S1HWF1_9PELO|nr:unnamed protein product [Caenorhabditis auriculariae]
MESFVIVRGYQRVVEVTAEVDGIISKKTLRAAFQLEEDVPIGLFRNNRGLKCREDDYFELQDGWNGAEYELRWEQERRSRPATPAGQDRARSRPSTSMDQNKRPISPYYPALSPEPAPSSEAFIQWMFYLHDQLHGKATTICVHPHFFVTFRHGTHQKFNLNDTMKMYRAQEEVGEENGIEVSVANINEPLDFVLLKSQFDVVKLGPPIDHPRESEPFTLVGFGNDRGYISYLPGAIHYVRDYSFHNDDRRMGPFILGSCASSRGDSGAGIWGSRGLLGMNFGCTMMPPTLHHDAITEAAIFSAKNIICPSFRFKDAFMEELAKEEPAKEHGKVTSPPRKKAAVMTEIDGIGRLFGKEIYSTGHKELTNFSGTDFEPLI